jgi:hypothetical protein
MIVRIAGHSSSFIPARVENIAILEEGNGTFSHPTFPHMQDEESIQQGLVSGKSQEPSVLVSNETSIETQCC